MNGRKRSMATGHTVPLLLWEWALLGEVHMVAQEWEALEKNTPMWEGIISKLVPKNIEEEDSDWNKEDCRPAESQFKDATIAAEVDTEDTMEESMAEALPVQHSDEASVGPGSQDMVKIHMGDDDLE